MRITIVALYNTVIKLREIAVILKNGRIETIFVFDSASSLNLNVHITPRKVSNQ